MLKYILTTRCMRECSYCITKNLKAKEVYSDYKLIQAFCLAASHAGFENIMLTGGEPTLFEYFHRVERLAFTFFDKVYLITANPEVLNTPSVYIEAVTFSMHDRASTKLLAESGNTTYASILQYLYTPELPLKLKKQGFSGLTINEDQRGNTPFTESLPEIENFSIRINRKGEMHG